MPRDHNSKLIWNGASANWLTIPVEPEGLCCGMCQEASVQMGGRKKALQRMCPGCCWIEEGAPFQQLM